MVVCNDPSEGCLHESGLNQPRLIWQLQRLQPPPAAGSCAGPPDVPDHPHAEVRMGWSSPRCGIWVHTHAPLAMILGLSWPLKSLFSTFKGLNIKANGSFYPQL